MSYFSGHVHTVFFENDAQDFYIFKLRLDEGAEEGNSFDAMFDTESTVVTAKGNVPGMKLQIGSWIGFEGKWVNHEKYGRQIQITRAPVIREWNATVAVAMLTGKGVGGRVARKMASELGDDLIRALDEQDGEALQVDGITDFMVQHALQMWREIKSFHKTLDFLQKVGVGRSMVTKVWAAFGDDAEKVLTEDPWSLVEIDGIKFPQADEVARKMGLALDDPKRYRGAVLYVCKTARGMGHIYMGTGDIRQAAQAFVGNLSAQDVALALRDLHNGGKVVIDQKTRPGTVAVYEPWLYRIEKECSELLASRVQTASFDEEEREEYVRALAAGGSKAEVAAESDPTNLRAVAKAALDDWAAGSNVALSDMQLDGALNALTEPVSILTGLPGTGKTTTLNRVVSVLRDAGVRMLLIAPTGIAAKRIKTITGEEAATIHRAFGARGFSGEERESTYHGIVEDPNQDRKLGGDGSLEMWACSDTPHPADVIICDESSMVDQHLLYRILTCTKPTARLVFVGDAAQLPSVGPGNVLRELIASDLFPTVALTEIFRQDDTSDIVMAAHDIYKGNVPETKTTNDSDFNLLPLAREDDILKTIVRLAEKLYSERREFQIISPKHGGTLGVTNLNARLRDVLNPRSPGVHEMKMGNETLREGDRVMIVKNDYQLNVFNGDVGKVVQLHRRDREVEVKIHGPPVMHVRIPLKKAPGMLRLAYAMTVHKSQGQEYGYIVMPLVRSFAHQLQRNLLYTGITRAKERVILLGHGNALAQAVDNNKVDARNTLFLDRLHLAFEDADSELGRAVLSGKAVG